MDKPEALRMEDVRRIMDNANAELRRLHEENKLLHERHHDDNVEYTRVLAQRDALLEALQDLCDTLGECGMTERARGTIEAVEGENHAKSL